MSLVLFRYAVLSVVPLGLAACQTTDEGTTSGPPTHFTQARQVEEERLPVPATPPAPYQPPLQLRELPNKPVPKPSKANPGLKAIESANTVARYRSLPDGFINAVQYYDFEPGALYEVFTAPGYVTTIMLQPDEELVTYAAGDTVRWVIGDVTSGTAAGKQTHVLIKPIRPKIRTNIVITTNKRVYLVEARSVSGNTYNAAIAWNYPHEEMAQQIAQIEQANGQEENTIARQIAIGDLNFGYEISGDTPRWRPLRAFDDGQKTYIEFPPNLGTTEAPPLFVIDREGDVQLVNYRIKGRYYEVDRLIDVAELRLGEDPQIIVRITNKSDRSNQVVKKSGL
jgi:type IV secretion system protein VirB9